jgi:Cu-Zn family superoxide dismutase
MRRAVALVLLVSAAGATGCTNGSGDAAPAMSTSATSTPTTPDTPGSARAANGTFAAYAPGVTAVTYDPALVPVGATASVTVAPASSGTKVDLTVNGLQPNRGYGAHLHTNPCGQTGAAAGPHYQHQKDPAASASQPSVDPSYANPRNEVWLDFTTDAGGKASATAAEPWAFATPPRSLVIHAMTTRTAPGEAGTAGARAACLTLPG